MRAPSLVIYAVTLLHMYGNLIINGRQGTLLELQEEIRKHGYRPEMEIRLK